MKLHRISLISFITFITGALSVMAAGWPSNYGGVMLQGFWWDSYTDSKWTALESQADELAGYFDIIWVPNSGQSSGSPTMGYLPIYWFTNHNSSFGTEAQLRSMINTFRSKNVNVIMDLVINHRVGKSNWADFPAETWNGTTYQMDNSCVCRTDEWGRNGGNPTGANDEGDDFDGGRDLDHTNSKVQAHCKAYCDFLLGDLGYAGFRLDMVKGYAGYYTKMYNQHSKPRFCVGEYWDGYDNIANWIEATGKESAAFDFPFKYAVNDAFHGSDMSKLCWMANGTDAQPAGLIHYDYKRYAVTFIDNHDTHRDGNASKFHGNILAANAFMLCSPGTPCVLLAHWKQYKSDIKKMIAIRKACGVTNTSNVRVLQHSNDCYMAEVTGTKGKLVVKVGSSMASPSGYTNSQIKASGTDWCIWANVDVPATPGTVDKGSFKVYWDNSAAKWATPNVHYFGGAESSAWPGVAMTKVSGTQNVYEFTVPNGTTGLVFTDGGSKKTDDQDAFAEHLYGLGGDKGEYAGGDTGSTGDEGDNGNPVGDTMTVYFDNRVNNWNEVHYYYAPGGDWAGPKCTHLYNSIYKCEIPSASTMVIFNDGDFDSGYGKKTGDITINSEYANYIFYNTGNDGSILPSKIYVIGNLWGDSKDWKPNQGIELTKSGNVYRGEINLVSSTGNASFSFVQALSSSSDSWDTCNGKHRYGAKNENVVVNPNVATDIAVYPKSGNPGGACSFKAAPGTYHITVDFNSMKVTLVPMSLSLNKSTIALAIGESETLTAKALPEDFRDFNVTWTSSDESVTTVSTGGTVTATSKGNAVITATFGSLTASCNVYVGKTTQNILWSQNLNILKVGQSLNLTATATSGLKVSYAVTNGSDVAQVSEDGVLTALKPGIASIEARQAGNDDYAPAVAVGKNLTVTLNYIPGDVLDDEVIDLADAVALVNHILGKPVLVDGVPVSINTSAADVNGDGAIDVVDASLVVNLFLDAIDTQNLMGAPAAIGVQSESDKQTILTPEGTLTVDKDGTCRLYTPDGTLLLQTTRQIQNP